MTAPATHDPAPLYLGADICEHREPDEDSPQWADWDADHEYGDLGERICLLTRIGSYCPACTEYARKEFEVELGGYIDAGDCVHAAVTP